jgi:hypothetical protein
MFNFFNKEYFSEKRKIISTEINFSGFKAFLSWLGLAVELARHGLITTR